MKMQCNETDALLQVKYNITQEEWDNLQPKIGVEHDSQWFSSFETLTDYEACLPRDACSKVVVGGLPADAYDLSFDGKAIDIGQELLHDGTNSVTSTEIGVCTKPICKDSEALLEIQYWDGDNNGNHFRVEGKGGNIVLHFKPEGNPFNLDQSFACLPKDDACYTFLIGGEKQSDPTKFPTSSYSVIFDEKLVGKSDRWLFDSVQFGGSCTPQCNQDDESLVEFFLFDWNARWTSGPEYEYEWNLNVTNLNSSAMVSSGVVPIGVGTSPLVHEVMCVPKGSCTSFYISAPNVTKEYYDYDYNYTYSVDLNPVYSLTMDNVTYRKVTWYSYGGDNQTTNMGSCTVGGLCDVQTQDLFDLELHTSANYEPAPHTKFDWEFRSTKNEILLEDSDFIERAYYDIDSSYRTIECVPNDGCDLRFTMHTLRTHNKGPLLESYAVNKNGIQLDSRQPVGGFGDAFMTPFGQNCFPSSNSLPDGAIGGIVIASVVAVGAIASSLLWFYKRRQNQSSNGEEDPLHESLL